MKAIYTKIDDKVFYLHQPTDIPSSLTNKINGAVSSLNIDTNNKLVTQCIFINTLEQPVVKSNATLYKELVDFLKEKKVTKIDTLEDYFKVCIDYTIFKDGREVDHAQVIRPVASNDKIIALGVSEENECVYRRVKCFNPSISFRVPNLIPHGIMDTKKNLFVVKINDISIFQSTDEYQAVHNSTYNVPYDVPSSTLNCSLKDFVRIYSSYEAGIDLQPTTVHFNPRFIEVMLNVTLTDYTVVYDKATIDNILDENGIVLYKYYRTVVGASESVMVVEDDDPGFDVATMVKISEVIKDIPDIRAGEFVIYQVVED